MPVYSQICPLDSEGKTFKELICILIEKTARPYGGLIHIPSKFVLAISVKDH